MIESADRTAIAIAVLWREGRVLARRRRNGETLPGLWEFPGGKIQAGETPELAARRELLEEMSLEVGNLAQRETIDHEYVDRSVRIHVFEGDCPGEPFAPDGAEWAWLTPAELERLPVPEANLGLIARLARERVSP